MIANPENFQLMFIGLKDDIKLCIDINGIVVQMTDSVKLLGVTIDSMLNFNQHVQSICKKASKKVRASSRIAPNLEYKKNVMLYNSFVLSNFNYCPLIWMFSGKSSNNESRCTQLSRFIAKLDLDLQLLSFILLLISIWMQHLPLLCFGYD